MADWKVPPTQLIYNNLLAMLNDQLSARVYDTVGPTDITNLSNWWVLYAIAGGEFYGPPLTNPEADTILMYQLDSVAKRRDAAMLAADRAVDAWVGRTNGALTVPLTMPPGWNQCDRMRSDTPGGVEPQGAPPSTLYVASNRFAIAVTPT